MTAEDKPLVSFCLKSYNQRRYLKAALDGAFAQTYRPLEIVISDDGSTDGSWELIEKEARRWREEGGHPDVSVVLNRNETNLGNLGNWEKICSLARGELLVKADGDDLSLPERTARIVEAWIVDGRRATSVCHSGWRIGENGEARGLLRTCSPDYPFGAVTAYSRRTFTFFGPSAASGRLMDDEVYTRRARMLGPGLAIPDRLVRYRVGSGVTSDEWNLRRRAAFCVNGDVAVRESSWDDLEKLRPFVSPEEHAAWRKRLTDERTRALAKRRLITGRTLRERWQGFRDMGPWRALGVSGFLRVAFLLPRPLGDVVLFPYVLIRNVLRRLNLIPGL